MRNRDRIGEAEVCPCELLSDTRLELHGDVDVLLGGRGAEGDDV